MCLLCTKLTNTGPWPLLLTVKMAVNDRDMQCERGSSSSRVEVGEGKYESVCLIRVCVT